MVTRCKWAGNDPLYIAYHDQEWGIPLYDEKKLFEFLLLEGFQAGLSWLTILKKRENYRKALEDFDPARIASFEDKKMEELLQNPGIIRNRRKIRGAVQNAQAYLEVCRENGSFTQYVWQFCGGRPLINNWLDSEDVPAQTPESQAMSKDLKKRGFTFVGPTICYAFMQATGMVNDHTVDCFRHREISELSATVGEERRIL